MMINIKGRQMECRVDTRGRDSAWDGRESKAITVALDYATALELFENDAPWSVTVDVERDDGTVRTITTDMSEYAISGPITDNRDGTVTVRMGKYSQEELMRETLVVAPQSHAQAINWRGIIEDVVQAIPDDAHALEVAPLHPEWDKLAMAGATVSAGYRFRHGSKLYKVIPPNHTFDPAWKPGNGTESLYTRIDDTHTGSADDPIPYEGNMELVLGLHYAQGGVVYRCTRDTGAPVYHALADLVGQYVEVVG